MIAAPAHVMDVLRRPVAAQHLGVSVSTLSRLRKGEDFPREVRLTRVAVGWRVRDLDQWIESRKSKGAA